MLSGLRIASEIRNGRQLNGPMRMMPSKPSYAAFKPLPMVGVISPKICGETCSALLSNTATTSLGLETSAPMLMPTKDMAPRNCGRQVKELRGQAKTGDPINSNRQGEGTVRPNRGKDTRFVTSYSIHIHREHCSEADHTTLQLELSNSCQFRKLQLVRFS